MTLVNFGRLSVLVIGDDSNPYSPIRQALARLGITRVRHVLTARSAGELLESSEDAVDVVIYSQAVAYLDAIELKLALRTRVHPPIEIALGATPEPVESLPMETVRHFAHQAAAPLLVIAMLTEMLVDNGKLTPTQTEDVQHIQRAARQLSTMITALRARPQ